MKSIRLGGLGFVLRFYILIVFVLAGLSGTALANCSDPPGEEGVMVFNTDHGAMQYCNGDYWISLGGGGESTLQSGAEGPWESLDLGGTEPFAIDCKYRARRGSAWHYMRSVSDTTLLFDASIAEFKFGAIESDSKNQFWYRGDGSSSTTSGTPATVDQLQRKCIIDAEPGSFTFADVTDAALSTVILSNVVTIEGINQTVAVSVSGDGGPEVSIDGGPWGTTGTITGGQTLQVRLTSGNALGVTSTASVNVGAAAVEWSVSTPEADSAPDAFDFTPDVTNAALSALTTATPVTISGINTATPVSVSGTGAEISINGGGWVTSGNITAGQTLGLRLTASASFSTAVTATVDVGGVTDTWSVTTFAADTTPNAFTFTDVAGANPSTLSASSSVTISGINTATPVSATGGAQFRINGGSWVSSGNITSGQTLEVRLTSSASFSTAVSTTVTVGTVTDSWSVTTRAADTAPNAFNFTDLTGVNLSTLSASTAITPTGYEAGAAVSVTGSGSPQMSINGGTWGTSGTITPGQTVAVRLTSSAAVSTALTATVTIGGVSDTWSVTTRAGNSCSAVSKTWLTNCTATVSAAAHGANGTGTITDPGGCGTAYYGSGTFACADGTFTYTSGTCTQQTACDTTPNAFTFTDATGVQLSTLTTATAITISGINTSTPVSVTGTGATISINGGAWVTSGTITNGQTLAVRLTSSASFATGITATINIGGVTDSWSVTTRAGNTCPLPWGGSIAHGASVTAYSQNSLACGQSCSSYDAVRTCNDGTLSNAGYNYASCSVGACTVWVVAGNCVPRSQIMGHPDCPQTNPTGVACTTPGANCDAQAGCPNFAMSGTGGRLFRCE